MKSIPLNIEISQDLTVLNEQIIFHEKRAAATGVEEWRKKIHTTTAEKLRAVSEHIVTLQSAISESLNRTSPIKVGNQLTLSLDEIQGLPDELIKELSIDTDSTDFIIASLINEAGGILSLDKILVGLYKKTGEIHKRTPLSNRLYRMGQRGEIFSLPGKKGIYSTRELTPEEVEKILNSSKTQKTEESS